MNNSLIFAPRFLKKLPIAVKPFFNSTPKSAKVFFLTAKRKRTPRKMKKRRIFRRFFKQRASPLIPYIKSLNSILYTRLELRRKVYGLRRNYRVLRSNKRNTRDKKTYSKANEATSNNCLYAYYRYLHNSLDS